MSLTVVTLAAGLAILPGIHAAGSVRANSTKISLAGVQLYGLAADVSIFGSAYSAFTSSNCNASFAAYPFVDPPEHYYEWHALGFNLFRLPAAWQHLQTELRGPLNATTMQSLDKLVSVITSNGSTAILDVHNYARWYCAIIGQPENTLPTMTKASVSDEDFVDLWIKLSKHYKHNPKVMFQLMNEPHDLNITKWSKTNQKVVDAIRANNATNPILISGTQFARLTNWEEYSMAALSTVVDPIGNTIYDFHQYFDDLGGAYGVCEPWSTFLPRMESVTNFIRGTGRKAILTEFGGAPVSSCVELFNDLLSFLEQNRDTWVGWTAWGSYNPGDLYLVTNPDSPFSTLTKVLARYAPLA